MNITFQLCTFAVISLCFSLPYRGSFTSSSLVSSSYSSSSSSSSSINRGSNSSQGSYLLPKPQPWSWAPGMGSWKYAPHRGNAGTQNMGPPPRGSAGTSTTMPWNRGPTPPNVIVGPQTFPTAPPSILNKGGFEGISTQAPPQPNSVNPKPGCRVGSKVYRVGDKWTSEGGCGRQTCNVGGKVSILGCPQPEASEKCNLTAMDARQPWPQCCPQLKCTE